ncbi:YwmB family TATA-box binding protein [Rossellomorea vietnamensis]|uniref:YwmB family TATA-box binding protein n=1 Tax=Rossellomorea vietnamensis TaxID=218284 RepID=UPI003CE9E645
MKKYTLLLLVLISGICFTIVISGKYTNASTHPLDIERLADAVTESDGRITEWSLYARENLNFSTDKGFTTYVESMQKENPDFRWEYTQNNESLELKGLIEHASGVEMIKVITTKDDNHQSYVLYEFRGNKWDHLTKQSIQNHYLPKLNNYFAGEPFIFSCIKGEFSDTFDGVLSKQSNKLLSILDANEMESLKENDFYSISAFSNKFEQFVPTDHQNMNLQLGLRKKGMGTQTTFVIGTPILMVEY